MLALEACLSKELSYLGMMGSPAKIKKIFTKIGEEQIKNSKTKKIHSPVGKSINSISPKEIAVSIAAEIIEISNS